MDTITYCIEALNGAMLQSARAIQIEIAVSILVFHEQGGVSIDSKKVLRQVYASAGRLDCLTVGTGSYKTVSRRMGRCGDFYNVIDPKALRRMLKDKDGREAIEVIKQFIAPYEIDNMDDLAAHSARPRTPRQAPIENRRKTDFDATLVHIETEHVHVDVSPDVTRKEVQEAIKALRKLLLEI